MATYPCMKLVMLSAFALLVTSAARADERGNGREKQATFGSWFEQQVAAPTPLPPDVREVASRYRYVFVAGFLNQGFQVGYFNENKEALLEAGVSRDAIHIVFPASVSSVEETVARLQDIIPALAAKGREKLVLVGHSKGAVEVLAFVLSNPAFVREHVQAVFLVQGALGGSAVADFLTGAGHPLDERMPARQRAAFEAAARGGTLLGGWIDRGFQSLTHAQAAALWRRLPPPSGGTDRIYYVCSRRAPDRVSRMLALTARYLATYYGDNDGLIALGDQRLPGTGRVLATLDADHVSLTVARPVSAQAGSVRRAFTRALLMQLGAPSDHDPPRAAIWVSDGIEFKSRTLTIQCETGGGGDRVAGGVSESQPMQLGRRAAIGESASVGSGRLRDRLVVVVGVKRSGDRVSCYRVTACGWWLSASL